MEKNKNLIIVAVVLLVLIVVLGGVYYYLATKPEESQTKKEPAKTVACGDLTANTASSGIAPFYPVLKATINGEYRASDKICEWTVNNVADHQSYPVNGQCIFGGKAFKEKGTFAIGYKLTGQSCSKSMTITVQ